MKRQRNHEKPDPNGVRETPEKKENKNEIQGTRDIFNKKKLAC